MTAESVVAAAPHPERWTFDAPVQGYKWAARTPTTRGTLLLAHGFGEYVGRYVDRYHALIPTLQAAGFDVYGYDQRGHGKSEGRRAVISAKVLTEDHLKAREALRGLPGPLFAFGHSLGGLIAASSVARDPRGLSGVILSSPALLVGENEPAWIKRLAPLMARIAPGLATTDLGTGGLSRIQAEVDAYEADALMYHGKVPALTGASMLQLSADLWAHTSRWSLPTLIVHGTQDKITDIRGSRRLMQEAPAADKRLVEIEGGYHELLNDECRDEVRGLIVDWLRERTA